MNESRKVLVVDDEEYWRTRVSALVKELGYEPVEADGFVAAVRRIDAGERFALVVTDNHMGRPDTGIELIQYIGRRSRKGLRIVLHSSATPNNLGLVLETFPDVTFVRKDHVVGASLSETLRQLLPELVA